MAVLVGGGKYGCLGDCSGFASGSMVIVSRRDGVSGLTFSGRGPGEFGGEIGSVYVYGCDIERLRCCSGMVVYDCACEYVAYGCADIGVRWCSEAFSYACGDIMVPCCCSGMFVYDWLAYWGEIAYC